MELVKVTLALKISGNIPEYSHCSCVLHWVQNDGLKLAEFDRIEISQLFVNNQDIVINVLQVVISNHN